MKGYRIKAGDGNGCYGFEDDRHDAEQLLAISLKHDPKASIEPYEYESQSEKIYRLEHENDTLKKALITEIHDSHTDLSPTSHQKLFDHYIQQAQEGQK